MAVYEPKPEMKNREKRTNNADVPKISYYKVVVLCCNRVIEMNSSKEVASGS